MRDRDTDAERDRDASETKRHAEKKRDREGSARMRGCSVAQACQILCDPMDWSPLGSSVHGILQARILEWVVMPSSRGSSRPRDRTCVSYSAGGFFTAVPLRGEAPEKDAEE